MTVDLSLRLQTKKVGEFYEVELTKYNPGRLPESFKLQLDLHESLDGNFGQNYLAERTLEFLINTFVRELLGSSPRTKLVEDIQNV